MAIIKCKMCGGDLVINEGSTVCECEYCGTRQTVPSADNEKKLTLFNRAGRLLRSCEFDKAAGVFETIVADFPQEAEAYWGLVLCKYGIEYVDDPATGKKIPTCHRSSFDSVLDDSNFEQACENTDAVARRVYRDEARAIEDLRQAILSVSGKEEPYDVFISYKETDENGNRTLDSVIAQDIYKELTDEGYRVFFSRISLESKLGTEYEPYIFAALNSAKVMIVVGTDYENFDSVWVKNEWSRFLKLIAAGQKKTLIPVFKNMDAYDMPKEFAKLAAQDMGKVGAMQDLVRGVEKLVGKKKAEPAAFQQPMYVSSEADAKTAAAVKRGRLALEEGNWDRAKDYFEQALTLDAECAEAYFCMALAEAQCRNAEEYAQSAAGKTPERKTVSIEPDSAHIQAVSEQYAIPHFFEGHEIRYQYQGFDLGVASQVEGQKMLLNQEKLAFEGNRNISLAYRFAKGVYRETLQKYKSTLYATLEENVRKAEQEEQENLERKKADYTAFLEKTDKQIEEQYQQRLEKRENTYQQACKDFERAKISHQFKAVKEKFEFLQDYKDSEQHLLLCKERLAEAEEKERIDRLYTEYSEIFNGDIHYTIEDWESAKEGFGSLGDYGDAHAHAEECAKRVEQLKKAEAEAKAAAEEAERQRILEEETEKERKAKKRKKNGILSCVIAVLAIAAVLIVTKVVIPANQYKAAEALLEAGKYEEAIDAFEALKGYKDSADRIVSCETAIKEIEYQKALSLIDSGDYETAYLLLDGMDYKNSAEVQASILPQYRKAVLRKAETNSHVCFGSYEQDNDNSNGKEDISWIVLKKEGNRLWLISEYVIDWKPYNEKDIQITWENCTLRTWLNEEFMDIAFSDAEKSMIPTVTVNADPSYFDGETIDAGNTTKDKVFLLSQKEAKQFSIYKGCVPTRYAIAQGADLWNKKTDTSWYLRTPGYNLWTAHSVYTTENGSGSATGSGVFTSDGIRPSIWIELP